MYSELGHVLRAGGRPQEALQAFQHALAVEPAQPAGGYHNLAALLSDERAGPVQDDAAAAQAYIHARSLAPQDAQLGLSLGRVLLRLGEWLGANKALKAAQKLSPGIHIQPEHAYIFSTCRFIMSQVLPQRPPPLVTPFYKPERLWQMVAREAPLSGLLMEFGVAGGLSINFLASQLGARIIHGFDWFHGLPSYWRSSMPQGKFTRHGKPPKVHQNVRLHIGLFNATIKQTFASLEAGERQTVALAHIDCDLYSSTRDVLREVGPRLVKGSIVLFDEYLNVPGWENHEARAWAEICGKLGLRYKYIALDGTRVAMQIISGMV